MYEESVKTGFPTEVVKPGRRLLSHTFHHVHGLYCIYECCFREILAINYKTEYQMLDEE